MAAVGHDGECRLWQCPANPLDVRLVPLVASTTSWTFALLLDRVAAVPPSGDPGRDLIACSVHGYRAFALEPPDLYRLFFTAELPRPPLSARSTPDQDGRPRPVGAAARAGAGPRSIGSHSVEDVTLVWDAVCTGLAMREICGPIRPSEGARIWTATLQALLAGLGSTDQARTSL
jgi:hypothetical protein